MQRQSTGAKRSLPRGVPNRSQPVAAILARVSSRPQEEDGTSLDTQVERALALLRPEGLLRQPGAHLPRGDERRGPPP